ncbi:MAG: DUF2079 domain-containing protein [bacterium]
MSLIINNRPLFRRPANWLIIAMMLFVVLSFAGQYAKYQNYSYNALDLAIYTQVFHESSQGNLFQFSIHPHSYLGDHVELFLLALLPVYWLISHSLTLLALQTIALALGAIPLYCLAKRKLGGRWALGVGLAYLLSPFISNINFYEFHLLPFAIPLLLAAGEAYDRKAYRVYLVWSLLALTVREDVALVVFALGLLALIERRNWRWWLPIMLISSAWFLAALKIAASLGSLGSYKFLRFYAWLGPDLISIIGNFFGHPLLVLQRFISFKFIAFILGLSLPFAFLPLFRLRWVIPALPILIQLGLSGTSGEIALKIHYVSLIIPFLFIGSVLGLNQILNNKIRPGWLKKITAHTYIIVIVLSTVLVYSFFVMGPSIGVTKSLLPSSENSERRQLQSDILSLISKDQSLATGYGLIGYAAQRSELASLHYLYIGTEQYSENPYQLPGNIKTLLIDQNDYRIYHVVYPETKDKYQPGSRRIRQMIEQRNLRLETALDDYYLFTNSETTELPPPVQVVDRLPDNLSGSSQTFSGGLIMHGWQGTGASEKPQLQTITLNRHSYKILPITIYWSQSEPIKQHNFFTLHITSASRKNYQKEYPVSFYLPQSEWPVSDIVAVNYNFLIPADLLGQPLTASLEVRESTGYLTLDSKQSITPYVQSAAVLGKIPLGPIN